MAGALAFGGSATLQRTRAESAPGVTHELEYEPTIQGGAWAETPLPAQVRLGVDARGTGRQRYIDLDSGDFATLARSLQVGLRLSRAFTFAATGPWQRLDVAIAVDISASDTGSARRPFGFRSTTTSLASPAFGSG